MSQTAPPGIYPLQQQTLANIPGAPGTGGAAGPTTVQIAPATAETHYGSPSVGIGDGSGNASTQLGTYTVDGPTSQTLANRISMEFYNNGTQTLEVSTNQNFIYGKNQGRTIPAGAAWVVAIGPANVSGGVKHYILCAPGQVCSVEVSEVGQ